MSNAADDRRAPGMMRIPFDGMVEVGGQLGPSFEAQAVNLSEDGMHLRTAYLPDVGQPVTCRFDAGHGLVVVAAGEVLWKDDMGNGGEFGIRFTNLDSASIVSLQRIIGMAEEGLALRPPQGRKVRLHIEGLASPMRARVKGAEGSSVTAFSELGFLQVGKQLDLEDAQTGGRRPALIDRVDVEIQQDTRVPQLVVTLKYDDEEAHAAEMEAMNGQGDTTGKDHHEAEMRGHDSHHQAHHDGHHDGHMHDDEDVIVPGPEGVDAAPHDPDAIDDSQMDDEHAAPAARVAHATSATDDERPDAGANDMKSAVARNAAKVTPALEKMMKRAKTTMAILAARAMKKSDGNGSDVEIPVRRTTAPAPGGGLHTSGRKVVRGEIEEKTPVEQPEKPRFAITKKKAVVAGAIGTAVLLAFVAMRKPSTPPAAPIAQNAPPPDITAAAAAAARPGMPTANIPGPGAPAVPPGDPLASQAMSGQMNGMSGAIDPTNPAEKGRKGKPVPFGNGPVAHGNVIKIKMDGPIDQLQGASQPSGFTVVIPGRKSVDPAGPLASKDARISAIRMANESQGAELTVTFKDGVPNYQVKAHGDTLEMHLAKGHGGDRAPEAHAKKHGKKKGH